MNQPIDSLLTETLHVCSGACDMAARGHGVSAMQERVAVATPSKWSDAIVISAHAAGWIELALLAGDSTVIVWNHADLTESLTAGTPVSLHSVYNLLSDGSTKHSVLRSA